MVDAGGREFGERINLAEQLAENDGDSGRYELILLVIMAGTSIRMMEIL